MFHAEGCCACMILSLNSEGENKERKIELSARAAGLLFQGMHQIKCKLLAKVIPLSAQI